MEEREQGTEQTQEPDLEQHEEAGTTAYPMNTKEHLTKKEGIKE